MCGIIGCFPRGDIRVDYIRHRGPDGEGVVCTPEIAMGNTRLAILGLSDSGAQPKWSRDQSVLLTYNGEIYNYRRLGAPYCESDTAALVEWLAGQGCDFDPAQLDGMYAFAAWFAAQRKLVLARDPVGIKPLYIALSEDRSQLAFCSEIKGFFGVDWFVPRPNPDAAIQREFLQYGRAFPRDTLPAMRSFETTLPLVPTLLAGVYQVCPGQVLTFSLDEPPRSRFISLPRRPHEVEQALTQSVSEQSMSDVEVGVQLSGGIDSSLVAYEFARTHPRVHGFHVSVGFPKHNEEAWARIAAGEISKVCDFRFHVIPAGEADVRRVLPSAIWHMDEPPMRHLAVVGTYILSEYVRRATDVKVLLAGEGADEMFGGYFWHDGKTIKDFDRSRRLFDFGGSDMVGRFLPQPADRKDILRCQLAYDRAIYLPMLLARQDRMSMAHSIETRVPFLSNRFLSMPPPQKPGKVELKRQAARIFGKKFARRPKYGSPFPRRWFAHLPVQRAYLGWLHEPWEPATKNEKWTLAVLSSWAQMYLYGGWKEQTQCPSPGHPPQP